MAILSAEINYIDRIHNGSIAKKPKLKRLAICRKLLANAQFFGSISIEIVETYIYHYGRNTISIRAP